MNTDNKPGDLPYREPEIGKLISENHALALQLKEANELLEIKEEELVLLRQLQSKSIELKSLQEIKNDELETLKQKLLEEKHKAAGAQKREREMADELDDTLSIYTKYSDLQREYTHNMLKLEDAISLIEELKSRNLRLEEIAKRVALLESELELIIEEREGK